MKFVKERVNVICQELARLSISQKIKITDMQVKNGCYITPAEADLRLCPPVQEKIF